MKRNLESQCAPSRTLMIKQLHGLQRESRSNVVTFLTSVRVKAIGLLWLIECAPEIPRRDRAIGSPFFAELQKLSGRGKFPSTKSFRETFAHSVIVHRPDIGPAQIEKQKHLNGPAPNPAHRNQSRDNFLVSHTRESPGGRNGAIQSF